MKKDVLIGIGNPALGDEGIGNAVVAGITEMFDCAAIERLDLGTGVFSLIHVLENRARAVIVDCAFMREKPGTIRRFTLDQARSVKELAHVSLHEGDVLGILSIAVAEAGRYPTEIVIYGIEPAGVGIGLPLSATCGARLYEYCNVIAKEFDLPPKRN